MYEVIKIHLLKRNLKIIVIIYIKFMCYIDIYVICYIDI